MYNYYIVQYTPIYRAPVYHVPRFTWAFLLPNTGFMCKSGVFLRNYLPEPRFTGIKPLPVNRTVQHTAQYKFIAACGGKINSELVETTVTL